MDHDEQLAGAALRLVYYGSSPMRLGWESLLEDETHMNDQIPIAASHVGAPSTGAVSVSFLWLAIGLMLNFCEPFASS